MSSVQSRKTVANSILAVAGAATKVRFHSPASLTAPRSLERLVRRFKCDEIIYDPTQAMSRAKALVDGGAAVRASLGAKLTGLFYAPRLRTLYVALNSRQLAVGDKLRVSELTAIEQNILQSLRSAFAGQMADCPAVRVGFGIPRTELVPVDQRSVGGWSAAVLRSIKRHWKPAAIATVLGFGAATTAAAQDPAVSAPNLKVVAEAGDTSSDSSWVIGGGLTLPVGQQWGLQIEGGAAGVGDDNIYGTAAHLFTRNPDSYLLGLFAAYASEDTFGLEATRVGAEAEIYLNQISLLAKAGYQFSDTTSEGAFGDVELKWYVSDNFAVSAGAGIDEQQTLGHGSIEWQPGFSALPGLAFRVDGAVGDDDYHSILGGISYYFGTDASLKDRHRKQDPELELIRLFKAVERERATLCAQYGGCD
ncbi:MAG: hypothetical protein ABL973_16320 [Micropepsaceae bacterium]